MQNPSSLVSTLAQFRDRRFVAIFLLGFCSGFPWVLHGSVLTLWLQSSGLSRSAIGYIGAVSTVYAINWLWAPFVDRLHLPWFYNKLGRRRSWIVLCQLGIVVCLVVLGNLNPAEHLPAITLMALGIALCSATLDIAVDAYRINIFRMEEMAAKMPLAAAFATTGWWAGYGFIGGAIALALGGETIGLAWPDVYHTLIIVYGVLILLVTVVAEPDEEADRVIEQAKLPSGSSRVAQVRRWLMDHVARPFMEFFQRCGPTLAWSILGLLLIFRLGEAMLGRMSLVFYNEVGFTTDQISFYAKFYGGLVTAVFSLLGAVVNSRLGIVKGLFIGGVAMAGANLLFALLALVGPNTNLLMLTLLIDNFFQAFATVAFISFISYFTSRTYTGTQYALMSSISNFGRTTLAAGSGAVVDFLSGNWALFFVLTTLMVIPGLCLLLWVGRLLERETQTSPNRA